jgi:MoaA/NifB/PqqE/SkfB family radical SAM enzyme
MQFQKVNRKAYINFLESRYERIRGKEIVKSLPYYLGLDPSSLCQLRCPLCPTGVENEGRRSGQKIQFRNRTMLTKELFDFLLDELGEYLFLIMFYNWGEPLFHKNLPYFIRKAKSYRIYTEIHTNLSLKISDQYIEDLLVSGIDDLAASIDGFSQETYQIYRRGGNFELAKRNIAKFTKARDRLGLKTNIIWNFLVFSFNEREIEATRNYCKDIGIIFNRREAFIDNPDWLPSYRKHEVSTSPTNDSNKQLRWIAKRFIRRRETNPSTCAWHYNYSVVNADGSVSPCCAPWEQEHDFGMIHPGITSFADIWNNDMYRKSRIAFGHKAINGLDKIDTLCIHCPYSKDIQNLYSPLDLEVVNQFQRLYSGKDPLLEEAFDLLADHEKFIRFFKVNSNKFFLPEERDFSIYSETPSSAAAFSVNPFQWVNRRIKKLITRFK